MFWENAILGLYSVSPYVGEEVRHDADEEGEEKDLQDRDQDEHKPHCEDEGRLYTLGELVHVVPGLHVNCLEAGEDRLGVGIWDLGAGEAGAA